MTVNTPDWPRVIARVIARNFDPKLLERKPKVPRRMLADVGHEVLRPLQPANARSRAGPSEVSRPSGLSTGPLARQQADPTKAATGCDLRVTSTQGHSPCLPCASYSSPFSCAVVLTGSRNPDPRPVSPRLGQKSGQEDSSPQLNLLILFWV